VFLGPRRVGTGSIKKIAPPLSNYYFWIFTTRTPYKRPNDMYNDFYRDVGTVRPYASEALGFILNVPSCSKWTSWLSSSMFSLKHWIAIRKLGEELYFNLDSHLQEPELIGKVRMMICQEKGDKNLMDE
jgi:hypothetical protein